MLRHVVLLRFTSPEAVAPVVEALRALPPKVPSIRAYSVGTDLGLAPDNAHVSVIAEFEDEAGHAEYRDHPEHVKVIDELIKPNLEWRSATQHRI